MRPRQIQRIAALEEVGPLEQGGQVSHMVGVKVGDADKIDLFELGPRLAEAQVDAATGIDQDAGFPLPPDHLAGRGA